MSTQTIYFDNPSSITTLQGQVGTTPGQVNTTTVNATTVAASSDITVGSNISVRNLQDQVYNLQAAVQPTIASAGSMNTQSYFGADTVPNQIYRTADDQHSKHFYDKGGLTADNLQYLQLDSTSNIPSNVHTSVSPCLYQNTTGSYILSNSAIGLYYTGSSNALNLNAIRRREMWNLLQDCAQISATTGGFSNYTGFVTVWGCGLSNITDVFSQGVAVWSEANIQNNLADTNTHSWGNHSYLWRYDTTTKTVIARSVVSMTRALWGDSSPNWKYATLIDGYVTALGNDLFVTSILNSSTYGLLLFDINLNALSIMQASSFGGPISSSPLVNYSDTQASSYSTWGLQTDQIRGHIVKRWNYNELGNNIYTNLTTKTPVDIFNGNTGSQATLIYVSSSSQSNYNSAESLAATIRYGAISPLSTAKWDNACGKIIAWALCTGAPIGPANATGTIASANGMYLAPVLQMQAGPDYYVGGDILQADSFVIDPMSGTYTDLTVLYPCVDIRDTIVGATGPLRGQTGTWLFDEGYSQTTFTNGGIYTGATSGIQTFAISVCCMTGSDTVTSFIPYVGPGTTTFPRNKRFFQDLYGQYYYQYTDSTGTYFQQNFLADATIQLSDIYVKWYPAYISGTAITQSQYLDTKTNITYYQQSNGQYLSSPVGGSPDPNPKALSRQIIMNNGFSVRYVYAACNFLNAATGGTPGTNAVTAGATNFMNPLIPPNWNNTLNNCPRTVFADFNMPDGTKLDVTQYYTSDSWSLDRIDWNNFLNAYNSAGGAALFNGNYSKTGTYDATLIKNYFTFLQAGLPTPVVQVYVQGDTVPSSYNSGFSGVVPAGVIYFRVLGEVFNGQPTKCTFTPASINNARLTPNLAKQLNYYGGGLYANTSLWQDKQGNSHIWSGHGNCYYSPFSEHQGSSNYAARQLIADLAAGKTPLSASTIAILGLDNIKPTPGPSLRTDFTKTNCSIWNQNGIHVLDCTLAGITVFNMAVSLMANPNYQGTGTITLPRQTDGLLSTLGADQVLGTYRQNLYTLNCYGQIPRLSGSQLLECNQLVKLLRNYHNRYTSNRKRAMISNTTVMWDAKTLALQQIVRGAWQATPALHAGNPPMRDAQGNVDNWFQDSSLCNDDEIEGIVTCGVNYMSSAGKTHIKIWKISDATASYSINKAYTGPNNLNRPRFSVTYDGSLGAQFDLSSTGSNTGLTSTNYGNISDFKTTWSNVGTLGGSMMYLGVQGGKDIFGIGSTLGTIGRAGVFTYFPWLQTSPTTKLNISPHHYDGLIPTYTADGKIVMFGLNKSTAYSKFGAVYAPLICHSLQAFTLNDSETSIRYLWNSIVPNPAHPELCQGYGTGTSYTTGLTITNRNNYSYAQGGAVLGTSTPIVINDVLVQPIGSLIYFFRIDTGELIGEMLSSDFYSNECNISQFLSTSDVQGSVGGTAQAERSVGAPVYQKGNLYFQDGNYGSLIMAPLGAYGRKIYRLNIKYQTPQALNLTSLSVATGSVGSNNSQTVVFTPQDAIARNSNQWCFITTFRTTNWFQQRKSQYIAIDTDYDALYYAGITAIAIYDPTNQFLSQYQQPSYDISTKFINGGSWYERYGISFKNLLASGVVKFLYAGQVPYKVAAQSPFVVSDDQRAENIVARRQKLLLQQYYLAKNGSTAPYQNDGFFVENNGNYLNSIQFVPYYSYVAPIDGSKAVIFNESLGYTDVGSRPLATPL